MMLEFQEKDPGFVHRRSASEKEKSEILFLLYNRDTPDHQLLDRVPNLGPLISRWGINYFENC
jgi:hypothetical protein